MHSKDTSKIPRAKRPAANPVRLRGQNTPKPQARPQSRVLVVGEQSVVHRAVEKLSEVFPKLTLGEVADMQDALAKIRSGEWDAAVLDLGMLSRNGSDALDAAQRDRQAWRAPVLGAGTEGPFVLQALHDVAAGCSTVQTAPRELDRSREQLRALSARLHEAREEERAAISRRVHDELGQALTALHWDLSCLEKRLSILLNGGNADIAEKLNGMSDLISAMEQTVRKVASELRPPVLDQFGLVAAIEWQAHEFQSRYRIPCKVIATSRTLAPSRNISTAVFRIFQEILTNVARHASATEVQIQLKESPSHLTLVVNDDGRGIAEGQKSESLGIIGMRERALMFGGTVKITALPGDGTTVAVSIPRAQAPPTGALRKETLRAITTASSGAESAGAKPKKT